MTAVVTRDDLARLRALVDQWRRADREWTVIRDLEEALTEIEARRAKGGDVLDAGVHGDSVPDLHAAALLKGAELWGPRAELAVEETSAVRARHDTIRGRFSADVRVRCLNYAEIEQRVTGVAP